MDNQQEMRYNLLVKKYLQREKVIRTMENTMNPKQENRLIAATLFVFFVSGASSMLMGNLMPFLRETYDISYAQAGFLLSLPSWGNIASIFYIGRYVPSFKLFKLSPTPTIFWVRALA